MKLNLFDDEETVVAEAVEPKAANIVDEAGASADDFLGGASSGDTIPEGSDDFSQFAAEPFGSLDELETQMEDAIKQNTPGATPAPKVAPTTAKKVEGKSGSTLIGDGAADMYVETADLVVSMICAAIAGTEDGKSFEMDPIKKEKYKKITATYFASINFQASPGVFFALATIVIFGGPLFAAYNARKERVKLQNFNRVRNQERQRAIDQTEPGQQATLFDEKDQAILKAPPGKFRRKFEIDDEGFYIWTAPEKGKSEYIKQGHRTEQMPGYLKVFYRDFNATHGRPPANDEIQEYNNKR